MRQPAHRTESFRRLRWWLLLLFFLAEDTYDLPDGVRGLLLWLLLGLVGTFLSQQAAQNSRHRRRGVAGVRQESLELHLRNLLNIRLPGGVAHLARDDHRQNQL